MASLQEVPVHTLRPTQLTVGMIEMRAKMHRLAKLNPGEQRDHLRSRPLPTVVGPEQRLYLTDHHHLGRAATELGLKAVYTEVQADFGRFDVDRFWKEMDQRSWVHPLDENGVRHHFSVIPHHLEGLVDDVYRSLAGSVRDAGGFEKTPSAFAEFVWADFFRRLIAIEDVRADFQAAVEVAIALAHGEHARGMPGYRAGGGG
ncbi:MAG TPA: ParB-like protein [Anaeromyxobacter sp.]|nr:ParB-like protein [Anaeromyxobacter sp.]